MPANNVQCVLLQQRTLWFAHFTLVFSAQQHPAGIRSCNNATDEPCPRCSPRSPCICCDLCNPKESRDMFRVPDAGPKTQPRRSKIMEHAPNENDKIFRLWLDDWRQETSEYLRGKACVRYFGCSNVMTDTVFGRTCDTVHNNLIASVDDLYKETHWYLTKKYGQVIVDKIKEIEPVAPPQKSRPMTQPQATQVLKLWPTWSYK